MKKAVLSFSGGMDSTSLLLHLLSNDYEVHCISFSYGQKHSLELVRAERNISLLEAKGLPVTWELFDLSPVMSKFQSALTTPDIEVPEGHYTEDVMKQTVVPNRNAIFSAIIYGYALSLSIKHSCEVAICLGTHSGDHAIYPDCRPEFHEALEHAFKIGNWGSEKITHYLPYLQGDKITILQDAMGSCDILGVDFDAIFANTNTCYNPVDGRACGKCGACVERLEAFEINGLKDPVQYQ